MNVYVVTEGKTEAIVYRHWIPLVNPCLSPVDYLTDINMDNFLIVSARGYPDYFNVIDNAIQDVNQLQKCDRLVISIDSEEMTKENKYQEVLDFVSQRICAAEIKIVIQHFCFEAWALGNRKIIRQNLSNDKLREYKRLFDVRVRNPELLPAKSDEGLNRAMFAEKYLRLALNDKHKNLTYSKGNPRALLHDQYFIQVKTRLEETKHIASFNDFLAAFV